MNCVVLELLQFVCSTTLRTLLQTMTFDVSLQYCRVLPINLHGPYARFKLYCDIHLLN